MQAGQTILKDGHTQSLRITDVFRQSTLPARSSYPDNMAPRLGRPPSYDWETLTDGSIWKARQGEDFKVTTDSFRTLLRYQARKRGLPIEIHTRGQFVWFQFIRGSD